ncbi:MAG: Holliday junction resolvase RuvX [Ruminococcaceae bacterium]|nr:Holliday junction resolvase RuvX [Oscillospiraceae bacterium]
MIILAVDLGKVRTGVAICDKGEILASPVEVITEHNREKLAERIAAICKERKPEQLVLGLPKNMDGTEGESALAAREFGKLLTEKTNLPLDFSDERGTTITAHGYLNNTDTRGKKRKNVVDAVAATIILEDYLRKRKNKNG